MPSFNMRNATPICKSDVWFQGRSGVPPKMCGCIYTVLNMPHMCHTATSRAKLWREKWKQIKSYGKFKTLTHWCNANVMVEINILSKYEYTELRSTTWQQPICNTIFRLRRILCHIGLGHVAHSFPITYFVVWKANWRQSCLSELLHDMSKDSRNDFIDEVDDNLSEWTMIWQVAV